MKKNQCPDRELDVLACIFVGEKQYKSVAKLLNISPKTVESYVRRTMNRYNCASRYDILKHLDIEKLKTRYHLIIKTDTDTNVVVTKNKTTKRMYISIGLCVSFLSAYMYLDFFRKTEIVSNVKTLNNFGFIKRINVEKAIKQILDKQKNTKLIVISGVGGSGKTTIVRCFLETYNADIKWELKSETDERLENSFFRFAERISKITNEEKELSKIKSIKLEDKRLEKVVSFVFKKLKNFSSWTIVFDDLKDIKTLQKYLPENIKNYNNGTIIITTKDAKLTSFFPLSGYGHLSIPRLEKSEQQQLFESICNNNAIKKTQLIAFLEKIPQYPLDTAIAGHYIKNTGIKLCDYTNYLLNFSYDFQDVQKKIAIDQMGYNQTRFSIIASDFSEIIRNNDAFKKLLLYLCLMNSSVSIDSLKKLEKHTIVDDFIYTLQKYSLVTMRDGSFFIHTFVQRMGLLYMMSCFSSSEMSNLLKVITDIFVFNINKLTLEQYLNSSIQLESILSNVLFLTINDELKKRCKIRLSSTLLNCYVHFKSREFVRNFAKQIISENDQCNVLSRNDLAKLLEICGNYSLFSKNYKDAFFYVSKCLSICNDDVALQYTKAKCLCDMATILGFEGKISESNLKREIAFKCINQHKQSWSLKENEEIFSRYYCCYKEMFIHSQSFKDVIDLGIDILQSLKVDKFYYKINDYNGENCEAVFLIRRDLIALYNKVGNFKAALECAKEADFFLSLLNKKGFSLENKEATFRMREGYTFLRLNMLNEAYSSLMRCIKIHELLGETPCIAQALLYLTEVLMKEKKYDEAERCIQKSIKKMKKVSSNNDLFFQATAYYFSSILAFKKKKYDDALVFLNKFLEISKSVCNKMLVPDVFNSMESSGVFVSAKKADDVCKKLQKSIEIFVNVYDEKHPMIFSLKEILKDQSL